MKHLPAILGGVLAVTSTSFAAPVMAQDANVDGRVKKLEKEMRAVQRKVFPGGAGRFFEPEITPDGSNSSSSSGPSTSAMTDLIARMDALEAQLASVTGQVQQQGNSIRTMEARLQALEGGSSAAAGAASSAAPISSAPSSSAVTSSSATSTRAAGEAGIERPQSDDPAEDAYIYGYRLWAAKYYPEAQTQLKKAADTYPKHRRGSFARNLEGRSWLDEGKPATAAKIFYTNYKDNPRGERAPDSLYFLGVSLTKLNKKTEACEAFDELEQGYPGDASSRLASRLSSGRAAANCK